MLPPCERDDGKVGLLIMSGFGFAVLVATVLAVVTAARRAGPGNSGRPGRFAALHRQTPPSASGRPASGAFGLPDSDVAGEAESWLRQQAPPGR
jgi:hypothetical protein